MRRFLLGILILVILVSDILGIGFFLSQREKQVIAVPTETLPAVTESMFQTEAQPETEYTAPPETTAPAEEKVVYRYVPQYFQTDYPYVKFGNGTIATSGCSMTCLAMVATYLTDQEYTPPQMAYHFGSFGKNNIERLDYGLSRMQLPYERTENVQEVLDALRNEKVAILMMDEESVFTTEQHFIVVAGMNGPDKFIVNDPIKYHYDTPETYLREAYEEGFADFYLMRGFSGAWIFDKQAMGAEPFRFDASLPEQQENRYEGYMLAGNDIYLIASFVCAEAQKESMEVKQALAEVVLNRIMSPDYPNTVQDVIYQTEFYRAADAMKKIDEPEAECYIAVNAAMYGPYILPEDVCFYSAWEKGEEEWGKLGSFTFYKRR